MADSEHDPQTSPANIIRYSRKDTKKTEIVKTVSGQKEALKWLESLSKAEKEPEEYRYLWQWEKPEAALAYDLRQLDISNNKKPANRKTTSRKKSSGGE